MYHFNVSFIYFSYFHHPSFYPVNFSLLIHCSYHSYETLNGSPPPPHALTSFIPGLEPHERHLDPHSPNPPPPHALTSFTPSPHSFFSIHFVHCFPAWLVYMPQRHDSIIDLVTIILTHTCLLSSLVLYLTMTFQHHGNHYNCLPTTWQNPSN